MKTIALDAMGGDHAPVVEVEGAVAAARTGLVRVLLVGDEARLRRELAARGSAGLPIEVRAASDVITMHDHPGQAVRRKRQASMRIAADLVAGGEADAVVSAGNSGAMMACALFVLKRVPQLDRPGIAITVPTKRQQAVLLDMGANVECRPLNLVQYAVLGATYARHVLGRAQPKVGVLSNGSEVHKGTELTRESHRLLRENPVGFDYVGYVEGRDVFSGNVDVVVCDGFSGNLVLKVSEGVADAIAAIAKETLTATWTGKLLSLALLPAFRQLKRRIDYAEWGGAPLLGVRATAMICHGGSNAKAIKNALLAAGRHADLNLPGAIGDAMDAHRPLFTAARGQGASSGDPGGGGTGSRQGQQGDDASQDSRSGAGGSRACADQLRAGEDGRHDGRMDRRAHRDPSAAHPC